VKLIKATQNRLVFQMGQREERLLLRILELYPCVPSSHPKLSKAGHLPEPDANQRLLEEALAEHRAEKKKQVQALLADKRHLSRTETTSRLSLSSGEAEAILQVLNDVRVGSWVQLGSPEEIDVELDDKTAPHLVAMQMAGYFESQFLEALSGGT
jgi:hypothetical protein